MSVTSVFGKRAGTATINEFDDTSLEKTVRRAEEVARLAPENSEDMPMLGPQTYLNTDPYAESTAKMDQNYRAKATFDSLDHCRKKNMVAAGYREDNHRHKASGNTNGGAADKRETSSESTSTVRPDAGLG